jgi:hypothetical protein
VSSVRCQVSQVTCQGSGVSCQVMGEAFECYKKIDERRVRKADNRKAPGGNFMAGI